MYDIGLPLPWGIVPAQRLLRAFLGPDPVAGAEAVLTVPAGVVWIPYSVTVLFTTSVVVANRHLNLEITDGNVVICRVGGNPSQTAGQVARHSWFAEGGAQVGTPGTGSVSYPMPRMPLLGGSVIRTSTLNIDVGDDYGVPVAWVAEYQVRGLERAVERYERAVAEAIAAPG